MKRIAQIAMTLLLAVGTSQAANAQILTGETEASQLFEVTVLNSLTLIAPPAAAIVHDTSDNDQVFPVQNWIAHTSGLTGANVTLEAISPFVNAVDSNFLRDIKMDLAITSSDALAAWVVTDPTDQTAYASGVDTATVSAQSSGAGLGQLGLTVTFVETDYSSLAAGAYVTTVEGTITSN